MLLIGGYQRARALVESFKNKGYKITIINDNQSQCRELAELKGVSVIYGDGARPYVLSDANALGVDIAIALSHCDEDNLVICELCKKKFAVKKTIALLSDPQKAAFFSQMGVDSIVSSAAIVSKVVGQHAFVDEMNSLVEIGGANILNIPIIDTSPANGKTLFELKMPKDSLVGCIIRQQETLIPKGDTMILSGDTLIVLSLKSSEEEAINILTGK